MDGRTVSAVDAEMAALPVALRVRLIRLLETVENVGLEALGAPHVRHLEESSGSVGCGLTVASRGGST